jgi:ABC-type glucose/galactose transport system permease subunit
LNDELQQNVLDAAGQKLIAGTASGGTVIAGISTYCEILSPVVGVVGVISGTIVSFVLCYLAWKKDRLYCMKERLIIATLEAKEAERKDHAQFRHHAGQPTRRKMDKV